VSRANQAPLAYWKKSLQGEQVVSMKLGSTVLGTGVSGRSCASAGERRGSSLI